MSNTTDKVSANREYKSSLFTIIFGDKNNTKNILSLYNALYDTNYTDETEVKMMTLEDAIYIKMKNDISARHHHRTYGRRTSKDLRKPFCNPILNAKINFTHGSYVYNGQTNAIASAYYYCFFHSALSFKIFIFYFFLRI